MDTLTQKAMRTFSPSPEIGIVMSSSVTARTDSLMPDVV